MLRTAKAERIQAILDHHFPSPPIPLRHENAFQLLVAVVLSAQCTDERVNLVTPALFARAPGPAAMATLAEAEVHQLIRSCGLAPQKAKALCGLAQRLCSEFGGEVPRDLAVLETLPGVGHKTASVVMAQAFGVPAFPVDTHIHRLAWRWGLSNGSSVERTERDLVRTFPRERWNDLHLQIIWFGRRFCPAIGHRPADCPICSWAMSKARQTAEAARRRR
ncbi:MAG: endonuclease III [Planctomycetes bacterium]|jgi:endonuclease-3|nr:endonuclease III [Planctomycetota bacterium]